MKKTAPRLYEARGSIIRSAGAWAVALCLAATTVSAEVLDRIVAVVGHHIILASELEAQLQLYASQQRLDLSAVDVRAELERELLDQMVTDRLMLIHAERDTSVKVKDREVEDALDKHVERIQSQFSAPEDFYKQLHAEKGKTLVVFEESAHFIMIEEKKKYQDTLIDLVLKENTHN